MGHAGRWELRNLFFLLSHYDLLGPSKEKKKKERSANWLANSPQTNDQLALPACRPPPLGCLATPSVLLGCLMTLVAAVAQGLLMKPLDQSLLFKTWKLTDHWTGILGLQATLNLLCETNSAPNLSRCQNILTHTHTYNMNTEHTLTYCLQCSN